MLRYIFARCMMAVLLTFVVVTLVFAALHAVPGNPAKLLLSSGGHAPSPEAVQALSHKLGLDRPLMDQYASYLGGLVHFDLGASLADGSSVAGNIAERLPRTAELIVCAAILSVILGIPIGAMAAKHRGRAVDSLISGGVSLGISTPVYVVGTVLVFVFAIKLGWVPAGSFDQFTDDPLMHLKELALPVISLSCAFTAITARMARSTILEVNRQDWVRTGVSKGLSDRMVFAKHVLRNALAPVITVVGLQMGTLLGGTVLVETIFNWPGLSSMLLDAVDSRDYPLVQGVVVVIALLFILINLAVDVSYAFLDPRIKLGKRG